MKCSFFKQRTRGKGPKGRITLRESLTPDPNVSRDWRESYQEDRFGVGGGVWKQLF